MRGAVLFAFKERIIEDLVVESVTGFTLNDPVVPFGRPLKLIVTVLPDAIGVRSSVTLVAVDPLLRVTVVLGALKLKSGVGVGIVTDTEDGVLEFPAVSCAIAMRL